MLSPRTLPALLAILGSMLMAPLVCHAADRCLDTADELLFKVKSWPELRTWFESYASCDDGSLAEGVSDYVAISLACHWQDLPELRRQIKRNPRFEAFVIQHIDATDDSDDLKALLENATKRCPTHSAALCASLVKAAREALAAIAEIQ